MNEFFPVHTEEQHNVTVLHLVQLQCGQGSTRNMSPNAQIWHQMAFDAKARLQQGCE